MNVAFGGAGGASCRSIPSTLAGGQGSGVVQPLPLGTGCVDTFPFGETVGGYFSLGVTGFRWIKRFKGIWWMPWRTEAMKDVARCDKPRGGASTL